MDSRENDQARLTDSALLRASSHESAVTEFARALSYTAVQSPIKALVQPIDRTFGTNVEQFVSRLDAPKHADFNTSRFWIQQAGHAAGALGTFFIASKLVKGCTRFGLSEAQLTARATQNTLGLTLKEAALTGFVHDAVFRPTDPKDTRTFLESRLCGGASGALTMSLMTLSAAGLKSLGTAQAVSGSALLSRFSPVLRNDVFGGLIGGGLAGAVGSNAESLLRDGKLAGLEHTLQSAYTMGVVGTGFAAVHSFGNNQTARHEPLKITDPPLSTKTAIESTATRVQVAETAIPPEVSRAQPQVRVQAGFQIGVPEAGPFKDYADFLQRGQRSVALNMEGYHHPNGETTIYVAEGRATYNRPSLEVLLAEVSKTPDPTLIRELVVVDHHNGLDPWVQQQNGGRVVAETGDFGRVTLYRPTTESVPRSLSHEWSHRFAEAYPDVARLFEQALKLEPLRIETDSLVYNAKAEPWAVFAENLLTRPRNQAFELALQNPVKTALFARTLKYHLENLSPRFQGTNHVRYLELADLLSHTGTKFGVESLIRPQLRDSGSNLLEWLRDPHRTPE